MIKFWSISIFSKYQKVTFFFTFFHFFTHFLSPKMTHMADEFLKIGKKSLLKNTKKTPFLKKRKKCKKFRGVGYHTAYRFHHFSFWKKVKFCVFFTFFHSPENFRIFHEFLRHDFSRGLKSTFLRFLQMGKNGVFNVWWKPAPPVPPFFHFFTFSHTPFFARAG